MTILTEKYRLPDVVRRELRDFSRDQAVFTGGLVALCGVVGRVTKGAPAAAADAGNTGNGAISNLALGGLAEVGAYRLVCAEAVAGAGVFHVISPRGQRLEDAIVGAAYASPHLAFSLADGAADFAVGDEITITVPAGSGKYKNIDPAAVDGTQVAAGLSIDVYDARLSDVRGVVINGHAVVIGDMLSWPTGLTAAQKNQALAELAALGVKSSVGV